MLAAPKACRPQQQAACIPLIVVTPPTPVPGHPAVDTDFLQQARRRRRARQTASMPYSTADAFALLHVGWKKRPQWLSAEDMHADAASQAAVSDMGTFGTLGSAGSSSSYSGGSEILLLDAAAEVFGLVSALAVLRAWYADATEVLLPPPSSSKSASSSGRRRRSSSSSSSKSIAPLAFFLVLLGTALGLSLALTSFPREHTFGSTRPYAHSSHSHAPHAYAAALARAHHTRNPVGVTLPHAYKADVPQQRGSAIGGAGPVAVEMGSGHSEPVKRVLAAVVDAWDFH